MTDDLGPLAKAAAGMKRIVEEIDGAMNHGIWRDERGMRLKDTPEWVALYNAISDHPAAPAPVVPADGLDALLMDLHDLASDAYDNGKEHESNTMIRAYDAITALRSAPPLGARVKPLVWREGRDTWVSDCEVGTYRVGFDDGWWCSLEGAESWDWDSPDDPRSYHGPSTAQNAAQADFVARILAALLPAGEGEE